MACCWTTITAVLAFLLAFYKKLGIKGPKPWPLFGTGLPMMREGVRKFDMDLRRVYGPVAGLFQNRQPRLMVFDADMLKAILGTEASAFVNRDMFSLPDYPVRSFLPFLKDNHWRHVRSLLTPGFTSGKLRKMTAQIEQCSQCLVNNLRQKADRGEIFDYFDMCGFVSGELTALRLCGAYTLDVIASTAFGLQVDSLNDPDNPFVRMSKKSFEFTALNLRTLLHLFLPFLKGPLNKLGFSIFPGEAKDFFVSAVDQAIKHRRTDDDEQTARIDLLQLMINAESELEQLKSKNEPVEDPGVNSLLPPAEENVQTWTSTHKGLTHEELLAQSILFLIAGYETSRTALSFLGYQLAVHPEYQDKVVAEINDVLEGRDHVTMEDINKMKYLDMCLNESLRICPPSYRTDRQAGRDVTINGVFIPKGMSIEIPIYAIHNDPEYWPEPERYDPERFSPEAKAARNSYCYLPFGIGPRSCIGMRLALLELKMATVYILRKYQLVVCEETQVPLVLEKLTQRPINGLKLRVKQRV